MSAFQLAKKHFVVVASKCRRVDVFSSLPFYINGFAVLVLSLVLI